jgi:peptidoglycan-N-acetylglucosamine deacetylase
MVPLSYLTSITLVFLHILAITTSVLASTPSINQASTIAWHMPRTQPHIALTFDDGPDNTITPQLLDVLAHKNVRATFFVVGHMVAKYPYITQRIALEGHDIANHTWAHYRLDELSQHQIEHQIQATTKLFEYLNIPSTPYMRPPGGRYNNLVVDASNNQNLTLLMWDVNAADYKRANGTLPSPESITKRILSKIRPGSIVLMHNSPATVKALPKIIDNIRAKGLTIGKLKWTP